MEALVPNGVGRPMCVLTCAAMSIYPIAAQQTAAEGHVSWRDRSSLTGDWDGVRDELEDKGIMLRAHFVTESAANPARPVIQPERPVVPLPGDCYGCAVRSVQCVVELVRVFAVGRDDNVHTPLQTCKLSSS